MTVLPFYLDPKYCHYFEVCPCFVDIIYFSIFEVFLVCFINLNGHLGLELLPLLEFVESKVLC